MNPKQIRKLSLGEESYVTITWKGFFHTVLSAFDLHCRLNWALVWKVAGSISAPGPILNSLFWGKRKFFFSKWNKTFMQRLCWIHIIQANIADFLLLDFYYINDYSSSHNNNIHRLILRKWTFQTWSDVHFTKTVTFTDD